MRGKHKQPLPFHKNTGIYISRELGLAVIAIPKLGQTSTKGALKLHPQFERLNLVRLGEDPTPRIICFTRSHHERLVAGWPRFHEDGSPMPFRWWVQCALDNPACDPHFAPPQLFCIYKGRYLVNETYPLQKMDKVFASFGATPEIQHYHLNRRVHIRPHYTTFYDQAMWDAVTKLYERYEVSDLQGASV